MEKLSLELFIRLFFLVEFEAEKRESLQNRKNPKKDLRLTIEQKRRLSLGKKYIESKHGESPLVHGIREFVPDKLDLQLLDPLTKDFEELWGNASEEEKTEAWNELLNCYLSGELVFLHHDNDRLAALREFSSKHSLPLSAAQVEKLEEAHNGYVKTKKKQSRNRIGLLLAFILVISVSFLLGNLITDQILDDLDTNASMRDHRAYIFNNPELIFREIDFSKYVVWGKPTGTSRYLDNLYVFHVKGTASIKINLGNLEVIPEDTDRIVGKIHLTIPRSTAIRVNVDIPQDAVQQIEVLHSVPLPENVTDTFVKIAGSAGAIVTGWAGMEIAGAVGQSIGSVVPVVGGVLGRLAGTVLGGAGGATAGYLATSNFAQQLVDGLDLSATTFGERDVFITRAKGLIALELLSHASLNSSDFATETVEAYEEQARRRIARLFQSFGWKTVIVTFKES